MPRTNLTIAFATAVLLAATLMPLPAGADAITFIVPTDFATIQEALDEANRLFTQPTNTNTYTVLVEPGEDYPGGITLRSNIQLRGRETARTILNGDGTNAIITADGVTGVSVRNFTFRNAIKGISVSGTSSLTIENNVFASCTTGMSIGGTSNTTVVNNTFYLNNTAVSRDADLATIRNNIFSQNTVNISQLGVSQANIDFNDFDPAPAPGSIIGTNSIPNVTITNPDPLFVDEANLDFHLLATSPCIDAGNGSISDAYNIPPATANPSDIGAYGGPNDDSIPLRVAILTSSATASTSISLSWSDNPAYTVAGYKVYYGYVSRTTGSYNGTDAIVSGVSRTSPIDALNTTSITLTGLTATTVTPSAPALSKPSPLNERLSLSWTAVTGATSYKIHYGIASTAENTVNAGNTTSYTLSGLTNGQTYKVAVSAVSQATYYLAVTAYDVSTEARAVGIAHESAYSAEAAVPVGTVIESGLSNEETGLPEMITPTPNLPNTGCFIASAAYGSASSPAVRLLRDFRDQYLATNAPGRAFVRWYYANGPVAAGFLNAHPALKPVVRALLSPAVAGAFLLTRAPAAAQAALLLGLIAAVALIIRRRTRSRETAA